MFKQVASTLALADSTTSRRILIGDQLAKVIQGTANANDCTVAFASDDFDMRVTIRPGFGTQAGSLYDVL